ncbi:MAG: hypothetical protein OXC02_04485 [Rhodobacteraceae bacterium]|nr:hypothetical protein [Paracoccaceae bacterium]
MNQSTEIEVKQCGKDWVVVVDGQRQPLCLTSKHLANRLSKRLGCMTGFDYTHRPNNQIVIDLNTRIRKSVDWFGHYISLNGSRFIFSWDVYTAEKWLRDLD